MRRRRGVIRVTHLDRPFVRAFPRTAMTVMFLAACVRLAAVVVARLWPYRRELAMATVWCGLWWTAGVYLSGWWPLLVTVAVTVVVLAAGPVRRWGGRCWLGGRIRRRLLLGLAQTRSTDLEGRPPRVLWVRATPVGYRLWLRLRPGQSAELMEHRTDELRAAVRAREVRLTRDTTRANRVTVDVIRRDTLTGTGAVAWADRGLDVLSIWDPVHFGLSELGAPVRLSLVERAVLVGGNRGAGKSSAINVLVAHAAKSPDVHLLLIDPNKVQLAPWKDRALAFADHHPDDAIAVVRMWRDEIDRRLDLFTHLPGVPINLTQDLAAEYGLPPWLLVIDELAYHLAVAGTSAQQKEFYALLRDGVARGRAAGMGAVVATQRPTHDLIPTSLRDLFDVRIAFRTMTRTSSDVILGDEWSRRGFCAIDIDLTARGVAWLLAEDTTPVRLKTVWIPPELRAELSVTKVRHKPALPGGGSVRGVGGGAV